MKMSVFTLVVCSSCKLVNLFLVFVFCKLVIRGKKMDRKGKVIGCMCGRGFLEH